MGSFTTFLRYKLEEQGKKLMWSSKGISIFSEHTFRCECGFVAGKQGLEYRHQHQS